MSTPTDSPPRDALARLRFSIIGPLLAAPPAPGEVHGALATLAARTWRHPVSALDVRFGPSTIERWYYAARSAADPIAALRNRLRPRGRFASLTPGVIDALVQQYREHPGWTAQLHVDNLRVTLAGTELPVPSYPTVRRYLKAQGMFRQAAPKRTSAGAVLARDRLEHREVRSFELDHVSALWRMRSSAICTVRFPTHP